MIIINSKQLLQNIKTIFTINKNNSKICIVLKMDAYGFGIENVISLCEKFPVYSYGVTEIDEIVKIRQHTNKPILRLKSVTYKDLIEAIDYNVENMIGSNDELENIISVNEKYNINLPIWINLDSNLGRDGYILNKEGIIKLLDILIYNKINVVGIRTHHNETPDNIEQVMNDFYEKALIFKKYYPNALIHCACSYLYLKKEFEQKYNYDMVAIGSGIFSRTARSLYENKLINTYNLVYIFRTNVTQIREYPPNTKIGYQTSYITKNNEYIGTIDIGWFNGPNFISCVPKINNEVRINKKIYKIIAYSANIVNIIGDKDISVGDIVYYNPTPDYFNDILNLKNNKKIMI
jgi:alanine racemase